jgi:hypothetical protein
MVRSAVLGAVLLVVGERKNAFDVVRSSTKAISEVSRGYALVAPSDQTTFDRPESSRCSARVSTGQTRELEHTFDVALAPVEASSDLGRRDTGGGEPADPTFDRA